MTAHDIIKWLRCCSAKPYPDCEECPNYWCECDKEELMRIAADQIVSLTEELERVKRECDEAIKALNIIIPISRHCGLCLYNGGAEQCKTIDGCCGGTWRGTCAENGGADDARQA